MKFFVSVLCLLGLAVASSVDGAEKPNILYVLADDLGFSDLGCYGGDIETPTLDSLAAGGVRLTQFYSTGRCCPSRAAILTGQYPHRVGLGHMTTNDLGQPGYRGVVSSEAQTIAQVLKSAGYRSFMSGKWHLGTPDPTQHGFGEFYRTLVSAKRFFDQNHLIRMPNGRKARRYADGEFYATDAVTDHALDFLKLARQTPEKPWFLYLAYNAPHFPLHAPPGEIAKYKDRYHGGWDKLRTARLSRMKELGIVPEHTELSKRSHWRNYGETKIGVNPAWDTLPEARRLDLARRMATYVAMVDRLDQQLGRVILDLKAAGEFENTLIVFTSDNGACFEWDPFGFDIVSSNQNILHKGEMLDEMGKAGTFHSVGSGWANSSNTPWRLYKHFNHEGGIASPGIVHWPAGLKQKAGSINHQPAHIIDLLPTAVAVSGARYDGKLSLPGTDLMQQLSARGEARMLFFEHQGNRAVRSGRWKLVALDDQPWELYDFSVDRIEMNDLASKDPARVQRMAAAWDKWGTANQVTPLPRDLGVGYLKAD
jgi:arylsulfatase A-like enzyme